MARDQTTIVFLLLTNVLSVATAAYAMAVANGGAGEGTAVLAAVWPRGGR
jgi:hypothetical protein